jgi:hypothetical protein
LSQNILPVKRNGDKSAKQAQKQAIPASSEKILPESYISDPELAKIVKIWSTLPKHIKTAIMALIETGKEA